MKSSNTFENQFLFEKDEKIRQLMCLLRKDYGDYTEIIHSRLDQILNNVDEYKMTKKTAVLLLATDIRERIESSSLGLTVESRAICALNECISKSE